MSTLWVSNKNNEYVGTAKLNDSILKNYFYTLTNVFIYNKKSKTFVVNKLAESQDFPGYLSLAAISGLRLSADRSDLYSAHRCIAEHTTTDFEMLINKLAIYHVDTCKFLLDG